jgi:hypothetical protein
MSLMGWRFQSIISNVHHLQQVSFESATPNSVSVSLTPASKM